VRWARWWNIDDVTYHVTAAAADNKQKAASSLPVLHTIVPVYFTHIVIYSICKCTRPLRSLDSRCVVLVASCHRLDESIMQGGVPGSCPCSHCTAVCRLVRPSVHRSLLYQTPEALEAGGGGASGASAPPHTHTLNEGGQCPHPPTVVSSFLRCLKCVFTGAVVAAMQFNITAWKCNYCDRQWRWVSNRPPALRPAVRPSVLPAGQCHGHCQCRCRCEVATFALLCRITSH